MGFSRQEYRSGVPSPSPPQIVNFCSFSDAADFNFTQEKNPLIVTDILIQLYNTSPQLSSPISTIYTEGECSTSISSSLVVKPY